ncbi:hypothetical protein DFH09DRAFT_1405515 [Mycena vulgaris]|nr:hypothetical protein DFH09DRAFT_1405515 [Mycena vulgaris]
MASSGGRLAKGLGGGRIGGPRTGIYLREILKESGTVVVSNSGDFEIDPAQDATTNPSFILVTANNGRQQAWLCTGKAAGSSLDVQVEAAIDQLVFLSILAMKVEVKTFDHNLTVGRVSLTIPATQANELIALYESVRIASTWEGIQAVRELERDDNMYCNLTPLFGFGQAAACAEAGVTLISPFVGRILDWYKKLIGGCTRTMPTPVSSPSRRFKDYKQHGYKTIVMEASFRNVFNSSHERSRAIAPTLPDELKKSSDAVPKTLDATAAAQADPIAKVTFVDNDAEFNGISLHKGIKKFAEDGETLKELLKVKLSV